MQTISSKDNRYLKEARSLHAKKGREATGLMLAEGLRLAEEAAEFGSCRYAIFAEEALAAPRMQKLAEAFLAKGVPCFTCSERLLAGAATTEHAQGVLAVCEIPQLSLPDTGWFACCDRIADPGNLGTICRTAHAAGAAGLLLTPECADPWSPKVLRSTMGAAFKLPICRFAADEAILDFANERGLSLFAADAGGADVRNITSRLSAPHLWVLGAEAAGVSPFWQQHAEAVSLPMRPDAESLNVASAAAVLFYQSCFAQG